MAERPRRVLRRKQLTQFVGLRHTAIDDLIKAGNFPKPIPLGERSVGWLEDEIAAWQAERIAQRKSANSD